MNEQWLDWRKAEKSNPNGACVEVASRRARGPRRIGIRDSKYAARGEVSPVLEVSPAAFRELTARIKRIIA